MIIKLEKRNASGNYVGSVPAPKLKSGKRTFSLCIATFNQFFEIPADAIDIRLIVSKSEHDSAYEMAYAVDTQDWWLMTRMNYTLDGFSVGVMYQKAQFMFKRMVGKGYKYIRVDYRTPA